MHYFSITRLLASIVSAVSMHWHDSCDIYDVMRHPKDSLVWKHFNEIFLDFASYQECEIGPLSTRFSTFQQI